MIVHMLTKNDMELLEKRFVTKEEFYKTTDQIIELINNMGSTIISELGAKIDDINDILGNHERRIERLETEVF
jgi:dihydroxyacetone kinase